MRRLHWTTNRRKGNHGEEEGGSKKGFEEGRIVVGSCCLCARVAKHSAALE
jgi:hypothetical protein